jgi:hypothetical protein
VPTDTRDAPIQYLAALPHSVAFKFSVCGHIECRQKPHRYVGLGWLRWIAADCHRVCLGIEEGPQLSEQQIADRGFKFKVGHHFLSCLVEKPIIHRQ